MRWNAIVDTGDTPPALKGAARDPDKIQAIIEQVASDHGCEVEIWWDRYSWFAYVSMTGGDARGALATLEAEKVQAQVNTDEKKDRPWKIP